MVKRVINRVKKVSESLFIGQCLSKFLQSPCIIAVWYPQLEVAAVIIFLTHVFHEPTVLAFSVQPWLMLHAVLQGAAHDGLTIDDAVGLGDNAPIDGAGLMAARGAVILGSVGDSVDLVIAEPLAQPHVLAHDAGTVGVVMLTPIHQPQVMVSSRHQQQATIDLGIMFSKTQRL